MHALPVVEKRNHEMFKMSTIERLNNENWSAFINAPVAVLILGKSDCAPCDSWTTKLGEWLGTGEHPANVRFGKTLLDEPGMTSFKQSQSWIAMVDVLPFNAIYVDGVREEEWSGGSLSRLKTKLEQYA